MLTHDGTGLNVSVAFAPVDTGDIVDYAVEAEIQFVRDQGKGGFPMFGIVARSDGAEGGYLADVKVANGPAAELQTLQGAPFNSTHLVEKAITPDDRWHKYRLEVEGNRLRFFIDGGLYVETTSSAFHEGNKVGVASYLTEINVRSFMVIRL